MAKPDIYPDFPSSILDAFKVKVAYIVPKDHVFVFVFGEMSLKCTLNYVERARAPKIALF